MRRIIVAITGASGAIYGIRALELLGKVDDVETHVILTSSGQRTIAHETDTRPTRCVRSPITTTIPGTSVRRYRRGRSSRSACWSLPAR